MAPIDELALLLEKVRVAEDLIQRAEVFLYTRKDQWAPVLVANFEDMLERKRDQLDYEWHLVKKMGMKIATDRFGLDI